MFSQTSFCSCHLFRCSFLSPARGENRHALCWWYWKAPGNEDRPFWVHLVQGNFLIPHVLVHIDLRCFIHRPTSFLIEVLLLSLGAHEIDGSIHQGFYEAAYLTKLLVSWLVLRTWMISDWTKCIRVANWPNKQLPKKWNLIHFSLAHKHSNVVFPVGQFSLRHYFKDSGFFQLVSLSTSRPSAFSPSAGGFYGSGLERVSCLLLAFPWL